MKFFALLALPLLTAGAGVLFARARQKRRPVRASPGRKREHEDRG